MQLAPISIPVYKRLDHLQRCISALSRNQLAKNSLLYIFSDGPNLRDEIQVLHLRDYLRTIGGFARVIIKEQPINRRLGNIEESLRVPMQLHGRVIYVEEDLEVSPVFLNFMNGALETYARHPKVFSVTGYTLPCCVRSSPDVQASSIFTAWGCGLWADKYSAYTDYIAHDPSERMSRSIRLTLKMIRDHSFTQFVNYRRMCIENRLTPDLGMGFYMWHRKLFQVFPSQPYVDVMGGFDGSGWHGAVAQKFRNAPYSDDQFALGEHFDERAANSLFKRVRRFHGLNLLTDLKTLMKMSLGRSVVDSVRRLRGSRADSKNRR
jgi:hypothetical protein